MPSLFETGAFGRNIPAWHGEGNVVASTFRFEDIFPEDGSLGIAGINWGVRKRPSFVQLEDGTFVPSPDGFDIVRDTDNAVLTRGGRGVGAGYDPILNREAFSFLREAMCDHTLEWDTSISVDGGSTIAGIVSLPDSGIDLVKGDRHYLYLTVINTHDGSGAMKVFPTDVRVVCANTVAAALKSRDRALTVNVRHSGSTANKLTQAQSILKQATAEYQRFLEWQRKLTDVSANDKQVAEVAVRLFGVAAADASQRSKTIIENKVLALTAGIDRDRLLLPTGDLSAYNVFNGITNMVDHDFGNAGGESRDRFSYAMLPQGTGTKLKTAGIDIVADVFEVPVS
jgi:phage/plasmid-like protein (TIGR03299 family)